MPTPDPSALLEHRGFVRALAYGVLGRDDLSDDALQEAYLVALRHPGAPPNRLRSWLGSIGRRRAIDLHRREVTRRRHETAALSAHDASPTDVLAERADVGRRMAEAVLGLEAPYRDVLLLRYYEGLVPRGIAARLSVPVETVRTRVKRGLARLREVLDADGRGRERWLSSVGAFLDDAGFEPTAAVRCNRPLALGALTTVLLGAGLGGVALWRARATSDAQVGIASSVASVDARVAANGGVGGAPPPPPAPHPVAPAPDDSLRGTPRPTAKAAPRTPRFEVAVTAADDSPVAGAFVRVAIGGEPAREGTTDAQGRAGFDVPENARADVFVKAKGLASRTVARVATAAASALTSAGALTPERPDASLELALRRAGGLRVTATGPDGKPVAVVRTSVDDLERGDHTSGVGEVRIEDLEPGPHVVTLVAAGLRGQVIRLETTEGQTIERSTRFEVGASIEGVARDDTGAVIAGRVLVASATVAGFHPDQEARPDAKGHFRISGLDPDTAYAITSLDASTEDPTPSEVTAPATDVVLRFERRARVVLHAKPPPGGTVPDELLSTVCAFAVGYVPAGVVVDPTKGETSRTRIVLRRGGLIRARYVDAKGETLATPTVTYVPLDTRGAEGEPDERASHGTVHEQRVPVGRWRVRIAEASTDVTVEEGSEQDVVVRRP